MFQKSIEPYEGLLLVQKRESRIDSSIHMLFMRFDIAVIWLDADFKVVDKKIAKKWALSYLPGEPAKYVLETHPDRFNDIHIGNVLSL